MGLFFDLIVHALAASRHTGVLELLSWPPASVAVVAAVVSLTEMAASVAIFDAIFQIFVEREVKRARRRATIWKCFKYLVAK